MLKDGLYEQVINLELDAELKETDKHFETASIDKAEASKILSKYAAEVIERALNRLNDQSGTLDDQIALVNQVISSVCASTSDGDFGNLYISERLTDPRPLFY